jgi:DNA-binding PadR family transcriptional regulator
MVRKKTKGTELSVFKGREAKLNRAIFNTLTTKSPLLAYDIAKEIQRLRGLKRTRYTNVNRRIKALEKDGFIQIAGSRKTQAGSQGNLYQPTPRAYVALFLNQINFDLLLSEANEDTLTAALGFLILSLNPQQ